MTIAANKTELISLFYESSLKKFQDHKLLISLYQVLICVYKSIIGQQGHAIILGPFKTHSLVVMAINWYCGQPDQKYIIIISWPISLLFILGITYIGSKSVTITIFDSHFEDNKSLDIKMLDLVQLKLPLLERKSGHLPTPQHFIQGNLKLLSLVL